MIEDPHRWKRTSDPRDLQIFYGCPIRLIEDGPLYIARKEILDQCDPGSITIEVGVRLGTLEIEIYGKSKK